MQQMGDSRRWSRDSRNRKEEPVKRTAELIAEPGERVEIRDESFVGPWREALIVAVDRMWRIGGVTTLYSFVPKGRICIERIDDESRIRKPQAAPEQQ